MTGFISIPDNPLSKVTIASLEDLGYAEVNYEFADKYTQKDLGACPACTKRRLAGTEQLDLNQNLTGPRKLNEDAIEEARLIGVEFGCALLQDSTLPEGTPREVDGVRYIGDESVFVLVLADDDNDDTIVSLVVNAEDCVENGD